MKNFESNAASTNAGTAADEYLDAINFGTDGYAERNGDYPFQFSAYAGVEWNEDSGSWTGWSPLADELNAQELDDEDLSNSMFEGGIYIDINSARPRPDGFDPFRAIGFALGKKSIRYPKLTVLEALQEATDNIERDIREKFFS